MTHVRLTRKIPPAFSLDVDLSISGVTALYGPPGSGKSLLLEMIAGFSRPSAGRILLDDVILFDAESRVNVPAHRRNIAWIGPDDSLFPHLTLEQNLKFAAKRLPRLERHRRVSETLDRFQFTALARAHPTALTPEQKLRAAVARALVTDPKLLALDSRAWDEPLLREIRALTAAPVLLISANLDFCCAVASTLVILHNGRILQRGTPRDVIGHPDGVEVARALGIPNIFQGTITALDPTRNTSRIECEHLAVTAQYIPGHFRGDQVWVAIDPRDVRIPGTLPVQLLRATEYAQTVRLEFEGPLYADLSRGEYLRQRDNKTWQIEIPPEAVKIL